MNKQYLTSCSQCGKIIMNGVKIFGKIFCLDCLTVKIEEYKAKNLVKKQDINKLYDSRIEEINQMRNDELSEADEMLLAVLDRYQYAQETQKEPHLPAKSLPQTRAILFTQIVRNKAVCGIRRVIVESLVYNDITHSYYASCKEYQGPHKDLTVTPKQLINVDCLFETRKLAAEFRDNRYAYNKKLH